MSSPVLKCVLFVSLIVAVSGHSLGSNDVIFHLYTPSNPGVSQPLLPSPNSIMMSQFSLQSRTVFTIHNHGESVSGNFNAHVVAGRADRVLDAHLAAEDVNVIAVDWSAGSGMYSQGLAEAPQCGQVIADFANILIGSFGYSASQIRIVGVGLGGHIAGMAAKKINGVVPHVIALDPSLHGWTHHPDKLSPSDAALVEVLHATAGVTGYDHPLGHLDFYPNGGTHQNGCGIDVSCSHIYGYAFYAESILANTNNGAQFIGSQCNSFDAAVNMMCNDGERDAVFGGVEVKSSGSGIYSFVTNPAQPFARG